MNKQFRKQIIDDFIAFATNDENRAELFVTNKKKRGNKKSIYFALNKLICVSILQRKGTNNKKI